jgi:hypothetical protein
MTQAILFLVATALHPASSYIIFSRFVCAVHIEQLSPVSVWWISKLFVAGDIVSFTMQAGTTLEVFELGEMIMAGLFVQITIFSFCVGKWADILSRIWSIVIPLLHINENKPLWELLVAETTS